MATMTPLPPPVANPLPVTDTAAETSLAAIATSTGHIPASPAQEEGNLATTAAATSATATHTASIPADPAREGGNLATIASAQGVIGTGISPPPGGSGLLGYLSGAYQKLPASVGAKLSAASLSITPATDAYFAQLLGVGTPVYGTSTSPLVAPYTFLLQNSGDAISVTLPAGFNAARFEVTSITAALNISFELSLNGGTTWSAANASATQLSTATNVNAMTTTTTPQAFVIESEASIGTLMMRAKLTSAASPGQLVCSLTPIIKGGRTTQQVNIGGGLNSGNVTVVGAAAHSAAASGNPLPVGGVVSTAADATLAANDIARLLMSTQQQLVQKPFAVGELDIMPNVAVTTTADTQLVAAQASGIRTCLTSLSLSNLSAVDLNVSIKDGSTVKWGPQLLKGGTTRDVVFTNPFRGSAATAVNVTLSATPTSASVLVTATGFTGV